MTERDDDAEGGDRPNLEETTAGDHALALGMAALSAVPVVGGPFATLISEYVPRAKQQRMVHFVQQLGERIQAEQERIDHEFVRTSEFHTMVEDVLDRVQQRKNEEKFAYWAELLAGVASTRRPPRADRERLVDTLDRLRLSHLHLLHVIATTREPRPGLYAGGVSDTLGWKMPGIPLEDIRRDWDDLTREGVVVGYPSGMMTAAGAGNLAAHVTPYGEKFIGLLHLRERAP